MPTELKIQARSFLRPLRLDLYVLSEVAGPFMGGLGFFMFIFLMFQLLRLADFFIVHGVSGVILAKMTLMLVLNFLPAAVPIAFLIAVLVGFGRLSSDSELVAMKACGIGVTRLAVPVTLLAVLVVVGSLFLNMEWAPWSQREGKDLLMKIGNSKVVSSIREGTFTTGFFDLLIFSDKVDTKTGRLNRIFIYDEREPKNPVTVVAKTGEIFPVKTESDTSMAAMMKLYNGSIHRNDSQEPSYQKIDFGQYDLFLKLDEGNEGSVFKPEFYSYRGLLAKIATLDPKGYEGVELRMEYWKRIAASIVPLIFVLLGIGFGTVRTRAVRAGAILIAFVTLFVYWTLQAYCASQALVGRIDPFVAMQIPNLAVFLAGFVAFRKAMW